MLKYVKFTTTNAFHGFFHQINIYIFNIFYYDPLEILCKNNKPRTYLINIICQHRNEYRVCGYVYDVMIILLLPCAMLKDFRSRTDGVFTDHISRVIMAYIV